MRTNYTSKLFYRIYPYKITIARNTVIDSPQYFIGWNVAGCKRWMTYNNIEHRIYSNIEYIDKRYKHKSKHVKTNKVIISASIFVKTKKDFDKVVAEWPDIIDSITIPYDTKHINVLKDDRSVIIRKTLLYKKYKYVVTFKSYWDAVSKKPSNNVEEWFKESFYPSTARDTYNTYIYGYNPRVYLKNDDDLLLIKLSLDDEITNIVEVRTFDELKKQTKD